VSLTWIAWSTGRPLASVADGDDRYSPGYSILLHAGSSPDLFNLGMSTEVCSDQFGRR